jgi:hypothetical protein
MIPIHDSSGSLTEEEIIIGLNELKKVCDAFSKESSEMNYIGCKFGDNPKDWQFSVHNTPNELHINITPIKYWKESGGYLWDQCMSDDLANLLPDYMELGGDSLIVVYSEPMPSELEVKKAMEDIGFVYSQEMQDKYNE